VDREPHGRDSKRYGFLRHPGHPVLERELVSDVTILLADDNTAVLGHVGKLLKNENTYKVMASITDGNIVVREYLRLRPDVVILDISMGEMSGIDIARQLRDSGCSPKIIFLTVHEDRDYVNAAIGVGGSAYVIKSRLNLDLLSAIKAALANKLFVSASLMYDPG
jgi:DNA-binding NarL/FixJ family response regulator